MKRLHDALIFDLDGTLWDSTAACATGWNRALKRLGQREKKVTPEQLGGIMGLPHDNIYEQLFPEETPEARRKIGDACYQEELAAIDKAGAPLYPGVAEGLPRLAAHYPLYVVSNCLTDYLEMFLDRTGYRSLFRACLCHGMTGQPKAENLVQLMKAHKLKEAAYIGDTAGDESAAKRAGLAYYHVSYGFGRPAHECLEFASFGELVKFFLGEVGPEG